MKRVVITGADGFIGRALLTELNKSNVEVIPVTLTTPLPQGTTDVDVFFHFAREGGYTSNSFQNAMLQIENIANDVRAVETAISIGTKRFIYAQTYNYLEIIEFLKGNIAEPRYTNIYSASKSAAEIMGKTIAYNNGMEFISGACPMIHGPGNYHSESFGSVLLRKLINSEEVNCIDGNNPYDFVYIGDIVKAFIAIAKSGKNLKTYYVGHRKLCTFKEIATDVRNIVNPDCKVNFGAYPEPEQIIDWSDVPLDELYNDTGFECRADLRESVLETVEWIKATLLKSQKQKTFENK